MAASNAVFQYFLSSHWAVNIEIYLTYVTITDLQK